VTILYRTILFAALACYGWYYNAHLNVDPSAGNARAHLDAAQSTVRGGAQ
jgi:hypothetical protein